MTRMKRVLMIATLLLAAPVLSGCESFDADKLDIFGLNEKAKLPGERRAVFPEGVPGVTQGIPPEYLRGQNNDPNATPLVENNPPPGSAAANAANAPVSGDAAKPKPRKRVAASRPARITVQTPSQPQAAPQAQAPQQTQDGPWGASPPPQQQPAASTAWPAPQR